MDLREALAKTLTACGEQATDPLLFYYTLCDITGGDLSLKPQAEEFHYFNKTFRLVEAMTKAPEPKTIQLLLEKCKSQPDASIKRCLKWIHTLFEFYYRASHVQNADTEQILKSVRKDFFEDEQEGLILPKPRQAKQKEASQSAPPEKKIQPQLIPTPTPVQPPPLPNTIYKTLPEDACVYKEATARHLHLTAQCPCLRPALNPIIYKASYDRARYKDFVTINGITKNTTKFQLLSRNHLPPICATCGDFTPLPERPPKKIEYKQL